MIPQMTASSDRKHRIQVYPKSVVQLAINETVYGQDNVKICSDLFLGDMTYEQAAEEHHLSVRGLHKRVKRISGPLEDYLKKLN
ncbi:MAG: hypothetical protein MJZ81_07730 [Bacteroidales bacterium]|nr:hypothetical protein [Bacteroidales bacterium]